MLPTPSTSHLSFSNIYEPSEDTYLLLDSLSLPPEPNFLATRFPTSSTPPPLVLEIGTGSGLVLAFLTTNAQAIFGRSDILAMGTDVNPFACAASTQTVRQNVAAAKVDGGGASTGTGTLLDIINGSLTTPLRANTIDILVFNPPYVPSETLPSPSIPLDATASTFTQNNHLLSLSTDGGLDGMETTNALLAQLPHILSYPAGVAYVLLCARNRPMEVVERIRSWGEEWEVGVVRESGGQGGWERLKVLRVARRVGVGK